MNMTSLPVIFWQFLTLSAPALVLGFIIAGWVRSFLSPEKIGGWLGKGRWSDVALAAAVGVPLPLCSCSVIPTAVALKQKGASRAATSAFLISTPESGIDSILVTRAMMDWPMTLIRPVAAFLSAFLAGGLQLLFNREEKSLTFSAASHSGGCCGPKQAPPSMPGPVQRLRDGLRWSFNDLVDDLALWMTIGLVSGALLSALVPEDFFLGLGVWGSRLLMLAVGIPLYICASATTPIAASLVLKGLSPGAALILLLVGPATNITNLAVLRPHLGNRGIFINVLSIAVVALLGATLVDHWYGGATPSWNLGQAHQHTAITHWWEHLLAVTLVVVLARGLWRTEIVPRFTHKKDCCHP